MSDSQSIAPYKAEAMYRFVQVLDTMGYRNGKTHPVYIIKTTCGHDDTVRVEIETEVEDTTFIGEIVLKTYDKQWRLYCAASYIRFGNDVAEDEDLEHRWDVHFDYTEQTLGIREYHKEHAPEEYTFDFAPVRANKVTRYIGDV